MVDESTDLVSDIFVYKHQMSDEARTNYRREIARVLRPGGRWLISFADIADGYYSQCPKVSGAESSQDILRIVDPAIDVGSILFSTAGFLMEVDDLFEQEMHWYKVKLGPMHGASYIRKTHAFILRKKHG